MRRTLTDSWRHKGLRKKMIEKLKEKGIANNEVLNAMEAVPRHFFLDAAFDEIAYQDKAFAIDADQTISQPYTVAYQTQLLDIKPHMKVLEVGTGSAYQACVLAQLGARVYTIERQRVLFELNKNFEFLNVQRNIKCFYGDGFEGLPKFAPFDRVLITAAPPGIPPKLIEQLNLGGIMVLPQGNEGEAQKMKRIIKGAADGITEEIFADFHFVPMRQGKV